MFTKKYEVCMIDRNKLNSIILSVMDEVLPNHSDIVQIDYGKSKHFEEMDNLGILNCINIVVSNVVLNIGNIDNILKLLNKHLHIYDEIKSIRCGWTSKEVVIFLIECRCEIYDTVYVQECKYNNYEYLSKDNLTDGE